MILGLLVVLHVKPQLGKSRYRSMQLNHAGSRRVGKVWPAREKSLEKLSHGREWNLGHREHRQWDTSVLPLGYRDGLLVLQLPEYGTQFALNSDTFVSYTAIGDNLVHFGQQEILVSIIFVWKSTNRDNRIAVQVVCHLGLYKVNAWGLHATLVSHSITHVSLASR